MMSRAITHKAVCHQDAMKVRRPDKRSHVPFLGRNWWGLFILLLLDDSGQCLSLLLPRCGTRPTMHRFANLHPHMA